MLTQRCAGESEEEQKRKQISFVGESCLRLRSPGSVYRRVLVINLSAPLPVNPDYGDVSKDRFFNIKNTSGATNSAAKCQAARYAVITGLKLRPRGQFSLCARPPTEGIWDVLA